MLFPIQRLGRLQEYILIKIYDLRTIFLIKMSALPSAKRPLGVIVVTLEVTTRTGKCTHEMGYLRYCTSHWPYSSFTGERNVLFQADVAVNLTGIKLFC
jgi:hypothetical protein